MNPNSENTSDQNQPEEMGSGSSVFLTPPDSIQVIEPPRGLVAINVREIWAYRELFAFLVWRDVKVKYKQTLLGAAWAVLVPFFQMIVFTVIFGGLARIPTNGLPNPVYYMANLVIWTYFATSLSMSSQSMVGNERLLTKVYFPRLIVPLAPCLASLVDFLIAFAILIGILFCYGIVPSPAIFLLPVMVLMAFGTAAGAGLFLSALNVKYRDVRYVIPFLIQTWMYCSVIIPFSKFGEHFGRWRYLYGLNPMGTVVEGFRWCLMHHRMTVESRVGDPVVQMAPEAPWMLFLMSVPVVLVMLCIGIAYFKRMESQFADIV